MLKLQVFSYLKRLVFDQISPVNHVSESRGGPLIMTNKQWMALVFRAGTAESFSLKKTKLALQSWKPTFLFSETYFQTIIFEKTLTVIFLKTLELFT